MTKAKTVLMNLMMVSALGGDLYKYSCIHVLSTLLSSLLYLFFFVGFVWMLKTSFGFGC